MRVPKTTYRIYTKSDGRCILENPWKDESSVLELTPEKVSIKGKFKSLAGTIQNHKIWRIREVKPILIGHSPYLDTTKLTESELETYAIDQELVKGVLKVFNSGNLYYSLTYDLTHSLQHNYFNKTVKPTMTIVDNRYFFNEFLLNDFMGVLDSIKQVSFWMTKVIAGFVGMVDLDYKGNTLKVFQTLLISRISKSRLGTRYIRRGLDDLGNPANNVETEQILLPHDYLKDQSISSFVQFRGSAPLMWTQKLDLEYRPKLVILSDEKPTKKHFYDLLKQYTLDKSFGSGQDGKVVCVNLLDDQGFEAPLTDRYEKVVGEYGDERLKYESFSVNRYCKKTDFSKLDVLLRRVSGELVDNGLFVGYGSVPDMDSPGNLNVSSIQKGTTRVSCLDSLDRTNLVLSYFAKFMVGYQVDSISKEGKIVVQDSESLVDEQVVVRKGLEESMVLLTNLWADSGDAISVMYAGTGALKADVTRTGKRQVKGLWNDGINSLSRYYLNNFTHGYRQDCYDLICGKVKKSDVLKLVETKGKIAARKFKGLIPKNKFPGSLVPLVILEMVEPVYFGGLQIFETKRVEVLDLVLVLKEYGPKMVDGLFQLILGMIVMTWVWIICFIFKVRGEKVVDLPKLSNN